MFFGESIEEALSDVWQLAMALSSLKYIAGMVRQDVNSSTDSTGKGEEKKHSTKSHRPSPFDKNQASNLENLKEVENIKEKEAATPISSAISHTVPFRETSSEPEDTNFNISMVAHCQAIEMPTYTWIKEQTESNAIDEGDEQIFLTTMVAHQLPACLPAVATNEEISDIAPSMATHVVSTEGIENIKDMFETNQSISMLVHQVTREEIAFEQEDLDEAVTEFIPMKIEDEEINVSFIHSMCTHQLSPLETPIDSYECQVSMTVHGYLYLASFDQEMMVENYPGILTSMVSHQVDFSDKNTENIISEESIEYGKPMNYNPIELQIFNDFTVENITTIEEVNLNAETPFISSMCTHQLSPLETPTENLETQVSMAVHGYFLTKSHEIKVETDQGMMTSMIAHQVYIVDNSSEESTEDTIVSCKPMKYKMDPNEQQILNDFTNDIEDVNLQAETNLISSMCAHQLSTHETPIECFESQVSMAVHGHFLTLTPDEEIKVETDPGMMTSMVSHQVDIADKSHENNNLVESAEDNHEDEERPISPESTFIPSMYAHQLLSTETSIESYECQVSMAVHGYPTEPCDETIMLERDPGMMTSMVSHQVEIADKITENIISEEPVLTLDILMPEYKSTYEEVECTDYHIPEISFNTLETIQEECVISPNAFQTSMATHQLPLCNIQTEFSECLNSSVAHQESDARTESCGVYSMVAHHHHTDMLNTQHNEFIDDEEEINIEKPNTVLSLATYDSCYEENNSDSIQLISKNQPSNKEDNQTQKKQLPHDKENKEDCLNKRPVGNEDEEISKSFDNFVSSAQNTYNDTTIKAYNSKPFGIQELQKLVENEIGERKNDPKIIENNVERTETHIVNNVKGIEFQSCIVIHQKLQEEYEAENEEENESDSELVENKMGEIKNDPKIFENNVERTETHIVNNVKGIEFQSCTVIHQQLQEEYEAENEEENESDSELVENEMGEIKNDPKIFGKVVERTKTHIVNNVKGIEFQSCTVIHQQLQEEYEEESEEENESGSELVENDIGEIKNDPKLFENDVDRTETHIVNKVKGIEFQSCMVIHQQLQEEYEAESEGKNDSDSESISSQCESIDSVILTTSYRQDQYEDSNYENNPKSSLSTSDLNSSVENLIQASCTLKNNSPVIITTSQVQQAEELEMEDEQAEDSVENERNEDIDLELEKYEQFDDLKKHLRKVHRKSSNIETKIRETELLDSLFKSSSNEIAKSEELIHCPTKSKDKPAKTSISIAALNENVKKQTYKIRFKVKLNENSSQSSILRYLFGCFGGEKLFKQKQ